MHMCVCVCTWNKKWNSRDRREGEGRQERGEWGEEWREKKGGRRKRRRGAEVTRGMGVEKGKRESGVRRNTRSCQARWHTHNHCWSYTQSLLVLHTFLHVHTFHPSSQFILYLRLQRSGRQCREQATYPCPTCQSHLHGGRTNSEHTISGQWSIF